MSGTAASTAVALAVISLASLPAVWSVTAGFSALTSDGIRRVQLERAPRELPPIALTDAQGHAFQLSEYARPSSRVTFVTLTYLGCQSICRVGTSSESWLQSTIQQHGLQARVRLLTLSFDAANDTPEVLAGYERRYQVDPELWRIATVSGGPERERLLKLFDVVVLPDGLGGYTHNAALFVIDGSGRLARAYDLDRPDIALADALQTIGRPRAD